MMKFICLSVVLVFISLQGSNALKCYLCVGSTSSECANPDETGLVTIDCKPKYRQRRSHFEVTANNIFDDLMITTPKPDMYLIPSIEKHASEELTDVFDRRLKPYCFYNKIKASDFLSNDIVTRGCVGMPPHMDVCTAMKKVVKNIVECEACTTDKCN